MLWQLLRVLLLPTIAALTAMFGLLCIYIRGVYIFWEQQSPLDSSQLACCYAWPVCGLRTCSVDSTSGFAV